MKSYKVILDSHWLCNVNLVESSIIYKFLTENGHEIICDPSEADFIIISTCGVTNRMHDHYKELIKKYSSLKKDNGVIIVFGCLVKIAPEKLDSEKIELISYEERHKLDKLFYRTNKIKDYPPICDDKTCNELIEKKNILYKKCFGQDLSKSFAWSLQLLFPKIFSLISKKIKKNYDAFNNLISMKNRIFVEICRGCNYNCGYCVIKKAKGNPNSNKINDVISNIKKIYDSSKILVLVADDCAAYGFDTDSNLIDLIYEIDRNFPDCKLDLYFISPDYLQKFSDAFTKIFDKVNIKYIQIPLQSGSNKILKKMRRFYDVEKVLDVVNRIKKVSPRTMYLSQFIIGHPGETTNDFIKTLRASKYFDFNYPIGYSDMKGTYSSRLPNKKTSFTIKTRFYLSLFFMSFVILYKLYKDDFPLGRIKNDSITTR